MKTNTTKRHVADSSSSESVLEPPPKKKKTIDIDASIKALNDKVDTILSLDKTLDMPMSVSYAFLDTFKCIICQHLMKPPIILYSAGAPGGYWDAKHVLIVGIQVMKVPQQGVLPQVLVLRRARNADPRGASLTHAGSVVSMNFCLQ